MCDQPAEGTANLQSRQANLTLDKYLTKFICSPSTEIAGKLAADSWWLTNVVLQCSRQGSDKARGNQGKVKCVPGAPNAGCYGQAGCVSLVVDMLKML